MHVDRPSPASPSAALPWAAALETHAPWLTTIIAVRLGEAQAVDDVMQEVALAVSQSAARAGQTAAETPRDWGPWLYRIAVRQALLYRRKAGRRRRWMHRYAADLPAHPVAGDPLSWLLRDERDTLVRRAVARLPPREAEILLLKHVEDWSYREIAARLGTTPKAVETRLARARARLRSDLSANADLSPS
jgi:RNA polymerase sigma-70 factor (ECF subfamily)